MLTLILFVSVVAKPAAAPQPAPQVALAVSSDTGMDQCPAFTHYHAAGPDAIQDGKCHDDVTDAVMLPLEKDEPQMFVIQRKAPK